MGDDNTPERDVKDFEFQQLCKVRVSPSPSSIPNPRVQWLTSSSRFGLTFVASENGFKVLKTEDFPRLAQDHTMDRLKHVVTDFPVLASVTVKGFISHIALSCDDFTLAVATTQPDLTFLNFYDVRAFASQVTSNVSPFVTNRLNASAGTTLLDLAWNPAMPSLLVTCLSDGRLDMFDITDKLGIKANVPAAKAKCVCWSPKGKQLVAGKEDGTLLQYDPDLKEKRKWDRPTFFDDSYEAFDLVWLSTYTFLVAYISKGADCSDQPQIILVNGGKEPTATTYTRFDDVCYGSGEERQRKYFFNYIARWEMVLSGSSNASEVAIIGKHNENKATWEHWNLDDAARAECPLTDDYVDTYPMGLTVDFTSLTPIPKGESETYPPSPLLLVLTTDGLIIPYHMIYSHKDTPVITAAKEQLTTAGLRNPTGQLPSDTGLPSQSGSLKPLGAASVPHSSAASQSDAKPAFGAGGTSFSFAAPSSSGAQAKPISFGTAGSSTPSFSFAPEKNATSTPKSTLLVAPADSSTQSTKSSGAPPNVNLFKPTDTTTKPLNLGLDKTTTQPSTFQFGQPSSASASKPFAFGTSSTSAPSSGFSALAAAAAMSKPSTLAPFPSQPIAASGTGVGIPASNSQKPFTFSTASSLPATTTAKTAASSFSGIGTGSTTKAGTAAPLSFGTSSASAAGAPKPMASVLGTTTQPAFGATSAGTGAAKTTAGFGTSAGTSLLPSTSSGSKTEMSGLGGGTGTSTLLPGSKTEAPGGLGRPGLSRLGSLGAGAKPPPPPYTATGDTAGATQARPSTPVQAPPTDQGPSVTASVDHSFSKSISEEIEHFQKEMRDLKTRASGSMFVVGEKEEMYQLKRQTESISDFWNDIRNTTQEQSKEVQEQRSVCLDMFAMAEECRSREQLNSDPKYSHLLKMQALDPGSQDKLQQLQLQYQVLDQGIKDVDLILDTQWEEYQQRKKNKTSRVQRPTNDAIYRIVKSNQNIIHSQKQKLKELEQSLKQLKLVNQTSSWQPSRSPSIYDRQNEQTELSTLADSLVNPSARHHPSVSSSTSRSHSMSSINQGKLAKLRDHLYRRHVPVIKSTRPENLSMSRLLIPEELLQTRPDRQQSEETEVKSVVDAAPSVPSLGMSGNFTGMQRRSSPALKQRPDNTSAGFNLNQPKDPGFTLNQQKAPGFSLTTSQPVSAKDGKVKVMSSIAASKPPAGFQLNSNPLTASGVAMAAGSGQGTSVAGLPAMVTGELTVEEQPIILTNVAEINGQIFENITPEDSTENEEEEEEEYDEDDEYDEDESNGVGFGFTELPVDLQGATVSSSTPVSTKLTSKSDTSQTPINRKLFSGDAEPNLGANSFKFGAGTDATFSFGSLSAPDMSNKSKPDTKKESAAPKPFTFTPLSTASTKASTGFNFAMATGMKSDKENIFGGSIGDSVAINSSTKEERKSPVGTDPGTIVGFGLGQTAAAKPKPTSEVSSTDNKPAKPSVSQSTMGSLSTISTISTDINRDLSGLLESKSSSSLEELSNEGAPAVTTKIGDITTTAVVETESQSGVPGLVSSSSGVGDTDLKSTPSASGGLFGQSSASTQSLDSNSDSKVSQSTTDIVQPSSPDTTKSAKSADIDETLLKGSSDEPLQNGTSSAGGLFGKAATSGTSGGLFGKSPSFGQTNSSAGGLFGKPAAAGGLFGAAATSTGGLFGTTTTTAVPGGLFGGASTTASSGGLFGSATSTSGSDGLTGATATVSSTGGLFGAAATTASTGGLFGTATTTSSSGGLFGTTTTTTSSGGLFGNATVSSGTGGLFGATTTTSSSGGLFGTAATTSSTGGLFGTTTTTSSSGGLFGAGSTGSGGLFGQPSTASSPFSKPTGEQSGTGTGLFGQASSGSTSVFGQPASTTTAPSAGFGAFGSSSGSGFGSTATSGSGFGFGQGSPATSGFGGFGQSPAFGQPASTDVGGSGMFSGLGGKPSAEKAGTNVFGSGQSFGSSSQESTGLFGSGGAKAFGTAATSSAGSSFTGGSGTTFSGGAGGTSGFGGLTTGGSSFGSPPSFGGAPSFGNAPKFGAGASFGGQATFGSGATFGSTAGFGNPAGGSTFGSSSPGGGGGFASFAQAGSPTFGALAQSSDGPTFGALSQAAGGDGGNVFGGGGGGGGSGGGFGSPPFGGQQQNTGFGGNAFGSSPSFTGYRG